MLARRAVVRLGADAEVKRAEASRVIGGVESVAAAEEVCPQAAVDEVIAGVAVEGIVSAAPEDPVVPAAAMDRFGGIGADDAVVARSGQDDLDVEQRVALAGGAAVGQPVEADVE